MNKTLAMLTKNLYSLEEVRIALLYTIKNRNVEQSMFWCKELLDSGLETECRAVLFDAWLWYVVQSKEWLDLFEKGGDILKLCYALVNISDRDCSLFVLLSSGIQYDLHHVPDTITKKTSKTVQDPVENYLIHSLSQYKIMCTCWVIRGISNTRVYEILIDLYPEKKVFIERLQGLSATLGYNSESQKYIILCAYVIHILGKKSKIINTEIDKNILEKLKDWSILPNIMARRVFRIPMECLYALSARGRMTSEHNNFRELSYCESHMVCPYWINQMTAMSVKIQGDEIVGTIKEDASDDFYHYFFHGIDIPDEWKLVEREKSHGRGLLGPSESLHLWKLHRIWNSKIRNTLLWGKDTTLYGECPLSFWELGERYTFGKIDIETQKKLKVVKKKTVI